MISIAIANQQRCLKPNGTRYRRAIAQIVREAGFRTAQVSVALVDDARIHELNRQFLAHDCPTDVLSFDLSDSPERLEGEIIASAETACRIAAQLDWPAENELLLYLVHGALHLVGYDDTTSPARRRMRQAEAAQLARFDVSLPENRARRRSARRSPKRRLARSGM